ncbi:hypothetical protein VTI28DRAFT_9090 [Corynascus sepedonium]
MSSTRLGLRAGELASIRRAASARLTPVLTNRTSAHRPSGLPLAAPSTTSQERRYAGGRYNRAALQGMMPRIGDQASPSVENAQRMSVNMGEMLERALSMVVPGTFVLPPPSQFPKGLGKKLKFLTQWALIKFQEALTNASVVFSSKPGIFKRANLKVKRGSIIPTAKALHRAVSEALAAGHKGTLSKICTRHLAGSLLASIDSRPRGRHYSWELVNYTKKPFYPRLKAHRMTPISTERNAPLIRQAIVAISSKQRVVQYNAKGEVIPGSEKEMDVVENVAIACHIDPKLGWKQSEWRYLGTIRPTTLESWMQEKAVLNRRMMNNK